MKMLVPLITFLWKLAHQMILTNVERARRKMISTKTCELCRTGDETLFHRFRDCNYSLSIWSCFRIRRHQQFFNCTDWDNWICSNLCKRDFGEEEDYWHLLFGVVLKPQLSPNPDLVSSAGASNGNCFWFLNCDGTVNNNGSNAGCGGVLRNPSGDFKLAYMNKLAPCSVIEAELRAILLGIKLARDNGVMNLIIEVDSLEAVDLLRLRNYHGHHLQTLICEILELSVGVEEFVWKKIDRDRNRLADVMARQSLSLTNNACVFNVIPSFLIQAFNSERIGLHGSGL